MKAKGIAFERILGVLVTHDHADHIKTVGCLGERYHIPIYATERVHAGIERSRYVEEALRRSRRIIEKGVPFIIRDFLIEAFEVPHDSSDNVGYLITYGDCRFMIATDVGHITDTISQYACMANHLVLEANYDEEMLLSGGYPLFLKERVASPTHLKNIWLCHLSRENNHPDLAYKTVNIRMWEEGIRIGKDVCLTALKRMTPSEVFELE